MTTTAKETRQITIREAANEALHSEMERDDNIIIMGEDISGGTGKEGFIESWGGAFRTYVGLTKKFGVERVIDTPISEMGYVGAAIGAATAGLRPIAELMFSDFLGVCLDQLMNNCAKMRYMYGGNVTIPLTIITHIGAGMSVGAQHSGSPYSIFAHIPGLKVVAPSDPYTIKGMLISAIRDDDPVIFNIHKMSFANTGHVPEETYTLPLDKARVVREGSDVTIVSISLMTQRAIEAAATLEKDGISAEVVDLLSLSPLDTETILESVRKTSRLVVVDEDWPRCSVASEIVALVAEEAMDFLDAPPAKVTAPHTPVPYSRPLEIAYIPNAERIVAAVHKVCRRD
jgi:pyruvate/2-oxoglutarate/acetoin dehydrogenase E1 component